MQLSLLLEKIKDTDEYLNHIGGLKDAIRQVNIEAFAINSKKVKPNSFFVTLPSSDSSKKNELAYITEAIKNGARAVLINEEIFLSDDIKKKIAENSQVLFFTSHEPIKTLGILLRIFFGYKIEKEGRLFPEVYAVTGTNGKSSVVAFLRQIWEGLHIPSASIGTLGVYYANTFKDLSITTPDIITLYEEIYFLASKGIKKIALEASSHGIEQGRIEGLTINYAGFTNITHDHLDYHKTFENYLNAKKLLFTKYLNKNGIGIFNIDSEPIAEILEELANKEINMLTYGYNKKASIRIEDRHIRQFTQHFTLQYQNNEYEITTPLIGKFQVENLVCAISLCLASGVYIKDIIPLIPNIKAPSGRMENLGDILENGSRVIVDYAHTPDGLEKVLQAIREYSSSIPKKLIVVFGCGGDRDKTKRPKMGEIAGKYADVVIVTDDNPRTESPEQIRTEILKNLVGFSIGDRKLAIKQALGLLRHGDTLLIAGKGHEKTQIYGAKTLPFSDKETALELAKEV